MLRILPTRYNEFLILFLFLFFSYVSSQPIWEPYTHQRPCAMAFGSMYIYSEYR